MDNRAHLCTTCNHLCTPVHTCSHVHNGDHARSVHTAHSVDNVHRVGNCERLFLVIGVSRGFAWYDDIIKGKQKNLLIRNIREQWNP